MKNRYVWVTGIAAVATCMSALAAVPRTNDYGKAPLTFEANEGQTDERVKYLSRGAGYTLFLTDDNEAVLSLGRVTRKGERSSTAVRMTMTGSKPASAIRALDPQATVSNYIQGNNPERWLTGVKHFGRIVYEGVYPGINTVYYGNQRQLEYDFVVAPGADPRVIRLKFDGVDHLRTDLNGDLVLATEHGAIRQLKPVAYQTINGQRREIAANYKIRGTEASLTIGEYDRSHELVIDPILVYSGFLGGSGIENGLAIAIDSANKAYVAGSTSSSDFPIFSGIPGQTTYRGGAFDAFVVRFSAAGNTIESATFVGGLGSDSATGVAVDSNSNIILAGQTDSVNFPVRNAPQALIGGKTDAFLLKIAATGGLVYSTFIGGFEDDLTLDVAVDSSNNAVACGTTFSTNFFASGGLRTSFTGGLTDGWVFKMDPNGIHIWSTYFGGNGNDAVNSVAIDPTGDVYLTGATTSLSFPVTAGAYRTVITHPSATDAFVSKIRADGKALLFSTYLGGVAADEGMAIAVNAAGNAFVTGDTSAIDFPVVNPLQGPPGNGDTFVTKLNPAGSALMFSTYLAGSGVDNAADIAIDPQDNVYVFGSTTSTNFPVAQAIQPAALGARDMYVTKINAAGSARVWSTYLGGTSDDSAAAMAIDTTANLYLTGSTASTDYPSVGPAQIVRSGVQDAFITKISGCDLTLNPVSATFGSGPNTGSFTVSATNCPWTATASDTWITITGGASGTNGGIVAYTVAANAGVARTGFISVSGVRFTITQNGTTSATPSVVSIAPNAGSGMTQTFTGRFSTASPGGAPIERTYLLFNTVVNGANSCMVEYTPSTNSFRLINDNGATWSVSATGGSNATLSNSQCTLNLAGSSGSTVPGAGVTETIVNYALTFSAGFGGLRNSYLLAVSESTGLSSGWVQTGTWTVGPPGPITGTVGVQSLVPTVGSGVNGTFTGTFTHTAGANAHYLGYMLFLPLPNIVQYTATGTCLIEYNRISNGVRLIDNAGTGWIGPLEGYPVGTNVFLTNNYCSFNAQNVVATVTGTTMTVTVPVLFSSALGPVIGTFLQAFDVNGNFTGMTQFGNWVLPGAPPQRLGPGVVSITPQNTSGSSVTYNLTSSHPLGWNALTLINLLISDRIVGSPACHVVYFPGSDTLNLVSDTGNLVSPTGVTPGTFAFLNNSRCFITVSGAVITRSGTNITVTVPVSFVSATFAGSKNVYGNAFDIGGLTSHWVQGGLLTVQ